MSADGFRPRRDLGPFFDPRAVAIVGASPEPGKWGFLLARGALKGESRRSVFLVNRRRAEILGRPSFASLAELPEQPELVVLATPAADFERAVDEALEVGARALVVITAGLGETGAEARALEMRVVERVRDAGAMLVGPNCMGVFDSGSELDVSANEFPAGSIGLVSQSGNMGLEISLLARDLGLGFSRVVSLGNQADVELAEVVEAYGEHDGTELIAIYAEDFKEGRAFARAALAAREAGKPVLLLAVGGSEVGARAAQSHTGALVSASVAIDAACRAAGILRVESPKELVDVAHALAPGRLPAGPRVAVLTDGGGSSALAADLAEIRGLEIPDISAKLAGELRLALHPTAVTSNPVDLAGAVADLGSFTVAARLLMASDEVDAVLLTGYFGGYEEYSADFGAREVEVARELADVARASGRPFLVHTMYASSPAAVELRSGGVPVFREVKAAVDALARLTSYGRATPTGVPTLPAEKRSEVTGDGYWQARELVAEAGIESAPARQVGSADEALSAAEELGYPLVLKATSFRHKSDAGGVVLGIRSREELERAFGELAARLHGREYSVEAQQPVEEGVELIVGVRRDPRFGPVALVGLGGVYAELLGDVAVALAPVDECLARSLLGELRGARLLTGVRGRPGVDLAAAARVVAALSRVAVVHANVQELEVNPLLVTPEGAVALDARVSV